MQRKIDIRPRTFGIAVICIGLFAGCGKEAPKAGVPTAEVTVVRIEPHDTPVTYEYVGQTESSHEVQIRARVNGFLDKRLYIEGSLVHAGQVMFQQDPKPFQAQVDAAEGALGVQEARLQVANDNLAQVKPLQALNALSQKDLNDAVGQQHAAAAAVDTAKANVELARLNLSYTTITTPVTGLSSFAQVQDGAYVNAENSLLTTVQQMDPIWVNFTLSDNDMLNFRSEQAKGRIRLPKSDSYVVEIVLADDSVFPSKGKITFANASYNSQTGTFLLRATLPNPTGVVRPGQFVRVRVSGITRLNAILVPQKAVLQGAKGHFVVLVDKDNKAEIRGVQVGPWHGDDWFIDEGLQAGDVVVTEGVALLSPGAPVKIAQAAQTTEPAAKAAPPAPATKNP
ncbi:MAG TPA: efflux RND transporter periplasmic adaptor subunit [Burkholderiaceae bacterium]|nr:efflux RND transporter periplasmic adaptor subunit [Burkholderiaceae bacterium]